MQCTVTKGGLSVGVFVTHTEADPEDHAVRLNQMNQLASAVNSYKQAHRDHPVFVMGDFNVASLSTDCTTSMCSEYSTNMASAMGATAGLNDASPHVPGWYDLPLLDKLTALGYLYINVFNPGAPLERLDYILYDAVHSGGAPYTVVPSATDRYLDAQTVAWDSTWRDPFVTSCLFLDLPQLSTMSDHAGVTGVFTIHH